MSRFMMVLLLFYGELKRLYLWQKYGYLWN